MRSAPCTARGPARVYSLDLPPQDLDTEGLWFTVPAAMQKALSPGRHFMGALHALEHALIGILPLVTLADRNDIGGISTTFHPQLGQPAVFIYDGIPGGAGLSREAFRCFERLLAATAEQVERCDCANGCPGCVHSPKCGSGNRPLDKSGALELMPGPGRRIRGRRTVPRRRGPAPGGR